MALIGDVGVITSQYAPVNVGSQIVATQIFSIKTIRKSRIR